MNCEIFLRRYFLVIKGVAIFFFSTCSLSSECIAQSTWQDEDIGIVGQAGSGSYNSATKTFSLLGAGSQIGGVADSCHITVRPTS
jgi:hypothetical protein